MLLVSYNDYCLRCIWFFFNKPIVFEDETRDETFRNKEICENIYHK